MNKYENKQQYNRKRRKLFVILAASTFFAGIFYIIFDFIVRVLYKNEFLSTIAVVIVSIYICIVLFICEKICSYKHPLYGKFTFADEFNSPKKYKYKDINFVEHFKSKLQRENFRQYNSSTDFIKGTFYYKMDNNQFYYITLFIEQEMTNSIYKDYTENSLCTFLDSLIDEGLLNTWQKIYFCIIIKDDTNNKYIKKFIEYNLPLPYNIGILPIVVDEDKKVIKIASLDYGEGLNEFYKMRKDLLKDLKDYIVKK